MVSSKQLKQEAKHEKQEKKHNMKARWVWNKEGLTNEFWRENKKQKQTSNMHKKYWERQKRCIVWKEIEKGKRKDERRDLQNAQKGART